MKNLLICFGGQSSEYAVSLMSACSVLENLSADKYNVIKLGITKSGEWFITDASPLMIKEDRWLCANIKKAALLPTGEGVLAVFDNDKYEKIKIDVIFPVMHGEMCEDGCIQGVFEMAGVPYVGPGVLSSAVCMDKGYAKAVLAAAGIPQVDFVLAEKGNEDKAARETEEKFIYPVFVKPCNAGSSVGTAKAVDRESLYRALEAAMKVDTRVLIEEYIDAREIECAVLEDGGKICPSTLGEITPANEFYDYEAKYIKGDSVLKIPAPVTGEEKNTIQQLAVKAFNATGCRGMARVDFFISKKDNKIYLNEINTLPGFTSISMYPKLRMAEGVTYSRLIDILIENASLK